MSATKSSCNPKFEAKKSRILAELNQPDHLYNDASPKGSVDVQIRDLVDEINAFGSCVTTSSCAGRIAVFVEGSRSSSSTNDETESSNPEKSASPGGGKGGGGHWLFVSHDPVKLECESEQPRRSAAELLGLGKARSEENETSMTATDTPLIHLKFEPLILHILVDSIEVAHLVLNAALQAGYRESGVVAVTSDCPLVCIRTTGLALDSIVGIRSQDSQASTIVSGEYLSILIGICNRRFNVNQMRKDRLLDLLRQAFEGTKTKSSLHEDKATRRSRKKEEGLKRQYELQREKSLQSHGVIDQTNDLDNALYTIETV